MPIFVRNVSNETIEIKFTYEGDYRFRQKHPLKDWKTLRIPQGQLINLRYFLSEEPLHCNLHLRWYIERGSLIVENEHFCWDEYPEKCKELKSLYDESRKIIRMNNDRWRAVQASKEKQNECSNR